jgi:hypothetical protein
MLARRQPQKYTYLPVTRQLSGARLAGDSSTSRCRPRLGHGFRRGGKMIISPMFAAAHGPATHIGQK